MDKIKNRKLAAILFADVVGYTALMQKNEDAASVWLKRFQGDLNEQVELFGGQIVNFYGDGALCTFQSPLDAMRCAIQLQSEFQNEPSVPVRIGIHSGTVVIEGEKVYGNSVNIASRIESMGVPGAILVSKKIRDELRNQPDLLMPSLGSFEFKNVEEPLEVFALANEGFTVPKRDEIVGKLKVPSKRTKRLVVPSIIGIALLVLLGVWQISSRNSSKQRDGGRGHLSEELRQQRLAVMVFENQTMDASLDAFGTMVSDWITRGLMETGEANIISAANVQHQIAKAGISSGPNPEFASTTGVDVMIQGRYYSQEDQLIIHANIVEVASGKVIHALAPIQGTKDQMMDLLNELTQEVLGYWAVKEQKRFLQNPPKYDAYQEWYTGYQLFRDYPETAEKYLIKAFELDSTFFTPLFKLISLYQNTGQDSLEDEVYQFLKAKRSVLNKWESLQLEVMEAVEGGDILKSAQLDEKKYLIDKSDQSANYMAGRRYYWSHYPQKAIDLYNAFDPRFKDPDQTISWREHNLAHFHYQLGNFEEIVRIAEEYDYPRIREYLAAIHLRALIRLDSLVAMKNQLELYKQQGTYNTTGGKAGFDYLLNQICIELILSDKTELVKPYATQYRDLIKHDSTRTDYYEIMGNAAFYLNDYDEAVSWWEKIDLDQENWFEAMILLSNLGIGYAQIGVLDKVHEQTIQIDQVPSTSSFHESGRNYALARIQTHLGMTEEALKSIQQAIEGGNFFRFDLYQGDFMLKPLFGNPVFEELVKPRG